MFKGRDKITRDFDAQSSLFT